MVPKRCRESAPAWVRLLVASALCLVLYSHRQASNGPSAPEKGSLGLYIPGEVKNMPSRSNRTYSNRQRTHGRAQYYRGDHRERDQNPDQRERSGGSVLRRKNADAVRNLIDKSLPRVPYDKRTPEERRDRRDKRHHSRAAYSTTRLSGTVFWYDLIRGVGFVTPDKGDRDLFLRPTHFEDKSLEPQEGDRLSFLLKNDSGMIYAGQVRREKS